MTDAIRMIEEPGMVPLLQHLVGLKDSLVHEDKSSAELRSQHISSPSRSNEEVG